MRGNGDSALLVLAVAFQIILTRLTQYQNNVSYK